MRLLFRYNKGQKTCRFICEKWKYDRYIRDNCLFRDIDIYDKMSAQIKYKNDIVVNYSLTTYSPFGVGGAFNGSKGKLRPL